VLFTNALFFLNPRDRVQLFLEAGLQLGFAEVRVERQHGTPVFAHDADYSYFGAQGGLGVEWRVLPAVALSSDFLVFIRERTDSSRFADPEYVDPSTHLAANSSGGSLFRLGVTFYF
jgi:hypothetical protein